MKRKAPCKDRTSQGTFRRNSILKITDFIEIVNSHLVESKQMKKEVADRILDRVVDILKITPHLE